jgi:DNA-binding SARP family transcriptional activator
MSASGTTQNGMTEPSVPALRVLGPVRLAPDVADARLGAPKVRSLLALLGMQAGHLVSTERLIDELWDSSPPSSAATSLRVHISNLRTILGNHGSGLTVEHRYPGYRLVRPAGSTHVVDAELAAQLMREASDADPDGALRRCDEALALWEGEAYADVALLSVEAERHRLGELRLDLFELRAQARARTARPDVAFVAELERLVQVAPLREKFTELLIEALYRIGREADAVAAYQGLRKRFADELGLVPSRTLRELETAVLQQSATLDWTARDGPPAPAVTPSVTAPAVSRRSFTGPFVGRVDELARLRRLWDGRGDRQIPPRRPARRPPGAGRYDRRRRHL